MTKLWKMCHTHKHSQRSVFFSSWFSCVGVDEDDAPDIDIYHCPNCEKTHGKSTRE